MIRPPLLVIYVVFPVEISLSRFLQVICLRCRPIRLFSIICRFFHIITSLRLPINIVYLFLGFRIFGQVGLGLGQTVHNSRKILYNTCFASLYNNLPQLNSVSIWSHVQGVRVVCGNVYSPFKQWPFNYLFGGKPLNKLCVRFMLCNSRYRNNRFHIEFVHSPIDFFFVKYWKLHTYFPT